MAVYPIFPFDNAKVRKNHVFCKLNHKKDTKKDTFRKKRVNWYRWQMAV